MGHTLRHQSASVAGVCLMTLLASSCLSGLMTQAAKAQTASASTGATRHFTIAAQPLRTALHQYLEQSGVQVAYPTAAAGNVRAAAVTGNLTPQEALSRLLAGTGLTWRATGPNSVTLAKSAANITLGPIRVGGTVTHQNPTGPGVGYVATTTMSGTKTDTPITEIPNSIYVVTKQLMQDQQPQNVVEALRYTPGVYSESLGNYSNGSGLDGTNSGIKQRGFSTTSFVDGLALNSGSAGETAFIDRIEAVNGPASVMYGQTNPGGMIGISLKKPTDVPLHQVSLGFGSWGRYEATADVSDKITKSGNLRYRVAAMGVTSGTQVDHIDYHRVGVLPSLTWDIDPKTSLTLLGMYMYTPGNGTNYLQYPTCGTLIQDANCRRIPRNTFTGYKSWNEQGSKEAMFEYMFKHDFNKYISFSQTFRYENSHSEQNDVYSRIGITNSEVGVRPWSINSRSTTIGLDSRIYGKFSTGFLKHTWIVGSDFRQLEYMQNAFYDYTQTYTQNLYNPTMNTPVCVNIHSAACEVYGSTGPYNYFQEGVYFQDQIKWKGLSVLLGGREDWVNYNSNRYSVNNDNAAHTITKSSLVDAPEPQHAFTWRAGLIYNTRFGLAPYFSYSTSFVPQAGSTDYLGKPFSPLTGKQMEAGLKYKVPNKDILLTASAFRIDEDHYLISDLEHSGFSSDVGKVRSQGFEVSANTNVTKDLRLVASYTYTDIRFAKTNQTAQRVDVYGNSYGNAVSETGKVVPQMPRNMFSVFADYTVPTSFAKGLGINLGMRYVGSTYVDNVESFKTPSYILFDIGAHYDFGQAIPVLKGLKGQLAVSNLTNKYYVTSCDTSFCYTGQGRRLYGNLTYNW
ncbi:TonB-dependent siderophore receptor [Komagataeibacter oboediens]|uniref:TonB-dependent siderophore receptor n=2 Tax=Komagataeibacter oboediens TaxID=65958 RepID=A0ABS5SRZ2_9PROT|nr:TonB-dependent siderophore receptor [Komagataeibacter oboediens]MBT0680239.1 TonB-dependent siderophore receptor [Komagataeibacter oboediens]